LEKEYGLRKLPPCANPKCNGEGRIIFGRKAFCGECALKITKKQQEDNEKSIMGAF